MAQSILGRLADDLVKDSDDSIWPKDSKVRESWVRAAEAQPDLLRTTTEAYEECVKSFFYDLYGLGFYMQQVSFNTLARDLKSVRYRVEMLRCNDSDIMKGLLDIKAVLNVSGTARADRQTLARAARASLIYAEVYHDTANTISGMDFPEKYDEAKKRERYIQGGHLVSVGLGGANMLVYGPTTDIDAYDVLAERLSRLFGIDETLNIDFEGGSVSFQGDFSNIYRCFFNLASNAAKRGKATRLKLSATQTETNAIIQVADNGIGLPDEDKIFEYGESYSGGQGLGLFLARYVIESHKGTISAAAHNTDPDYPGALFTIELPKRNQGHISYPAFF